jgi:MraZ protein
VEEQDQVLEQEIKGQGIFVSTFTHSLDPKKRLTIPSAWRAQVGSPNSLYVLPDVLDKCLIVFPAGEMTRKLEKMRNHSIGDRKVRGFARAIGGRTDLVGWDSQGRIRINDDLLSYAGLIDQVVMVGSIDRFELWNPENLRNAGGMNESMLEEAASHIGF